MQQNQSTKKAKLQSQIVELQDTNDLLDKIIEQNQNALLVVVAENIYLKAALSSMVLKPIDKMMEDAQPLLDLFINEIKGNEMEYIYNLIEDVETNCIFK